MSDTAFRRNFGNGEYLFDITLDAVFKIQSECAFAGGKHKSITEIYLELKNTVMEVDGEPMLSGFGAAYPGDAISVIRNALEAGGKGFVDGQEIEVGPMTAAHLCRLYVYPKRPIIEAFNLAWYILEVSFAGIKTPDEAPKKKATSSRSKKGR